jgi:NAD(P)-dependent dehydrogenase (short-subunit alcohol dehydrogenase family)
MNDILDFTGKVVLVTGGARGVGRGITQSYLDRGAALVICGRNPPETASVGPAGEALFIKADVRDAAQVDAMVAEIAGRFGRLDVVVNNAGGAPPADPSTASPRFSESIVKLNLLAPLFVAQAANRIMQTQDTGGAIVNIASVTVPRPEPLTAAYGAAKAGLCNLSQALAIAWAPKVRVNAIIAGLIRTELAHLHYGDEEGIRKVSATIPLGRMASPQDIANACLYLSSPLSSYVTGSSLTVDGGGQLPSFADAASGHSERN